MKSTSSVNTKTKAKTVIYIKQNAVSVFKSITPGKFSIKDLTHKLIISSCTKSELTKL